MSCLPATGQITTQPVVYPIRYPKSRKWRAGRGFLGMLSEPPFDVVGETPLAIPAQGDTDAQDETHAPHDEPPRGDRRRSLVSLRHQLSRLPGHERLSELLQLSQRVRRPRPPA